MRLVAKAFALASLVLLVPCVVFADYITDAAQALKSAPVYVAPGTEGTNKDTAAQLGARLTKGDNIVLVMLPATAESSLGVDALTIATRLSEELGNERIVGLAVGNNVVGYAPSLPAGVAADQMRRARSVANDPVTALGTFVQNIHIWQRDNPQPEPSPIEEVKEGGFLWILISVLGIIFVAIAFAVVSSTSDQDQPVERTRFKAPDQVKELLAEIVKKRLQVNDWELQQILYQMCVDIERYFAKSSNDKKRDPLFFKERLSEVAEVLAKYVDVQDSPRYYHNPEVELARGRESIIDFSEYVLESIRRGSAEALFDYRVNTTILQAQRFRSISSTKE